MRERITFIHAPEESFNLKQLHIEKDVLHIRSLKAMREDRLTFDVQELPQEVWRALKQCHQIHLRWVRSASYPSSPPFVSRLAPGLHIFFTPLSNRSPQDLICLLLRKIFGEEDIKCTATLDTFTGIPVTSERFSSSAAYQYYALLPTLKDFTTYITQKICPSSGEICYKKAATLNSADFLDIDFDTISQSLILSGFWHEYHNGGLWNEQISASNNKSKIEIGVLTNEVPTEPEELKLGGYLTILGEDSKPRTTLFSFPSRHHAKSVASQSTYSASFVPSTGLHPTLRLRFPTSSMIPPSEACSLHTYLTVPPVLFPDKYQLSAPNFLVSNNLHSIRSVYGETDLEAPDWAIRKWGSAMLVELAPPPTSSDEPWHADIPLHLRYLPPNPESKSYVDIPWPVVFWACVAEEGTKMANSPFDRVNLGYDGLFGPRTMFYHLSPDTSNKSRDSLVERLEVPVLPANKSNWIEAGTILVIVLGFVWVLTKLAFVTLREAKPEIKRRDSKKKR